MVDHLEDVLFGLAPHKLLEVSRLPINSQFNVVVYFR